MYSLPGICLNSRGPNKTFQPPLQPTLKPVFQFPLLPVSVPVPFVLPLEIPTYNQLHKIQQSGDDGIRFITDVQTYQNMKRAEYLTGIQKLI